MGKPARPTGNVLHCEPFVRTSTPPTPTSRLCRAHGPPLLEAFPAKNRPPLGRPEGNGGFLAALRAIGLGLRACRSGVPAAFGPFRFAPLAALGFVLKSLVGKKHLLAGSEHELGTAFGTLQHLVVVFHEALSPGPVGRGLGGLCT